MKIVDRLKFGKIFNEFSGNQIQDFFAIWICDFPIIVIRKYRFNHDVPYQWGWFAAFLGLSRYTLYQEERNE